MIHSSHLPKNRGNEKPTGFFRWLLKTLGIAVTFALVDWSNARQIRRLLIVNGVPRAGILSEVVAFHVRNRRTHKISLAWYAFLLIWIGGGILLSVIFSDLIGVVYAASIGLWINWVILSLLGYIINRPKEPDE